jgi:hypothetical protein
LGLLDEGSEVVRGQVPDHSNGCIGEVVIVHGSFATAGGSPDGSRSGAGQDYGAKDLAMVCRPCLVLPAGPERGIVAGSVGHLSCNMPRLLVVVKEVLRQPIG